MNDRAPVFMVADDDSGVRAMLVRLLTTRFPGASVVSVSDADRVVPLCSEVRPHVLFLDWVFEGGRTGPAVCSQLKRNPATRRIPVILMTGQRGSLSHRFKAMRAGADLYLAKPFTFEEATGYARALLERRGGEDEETLRCGPLTLIRSSRTGRLGARLLPPLPPQAFHILWSLALRSPAPASIEQLMRGAWKGPVRDFTVKVAVKRLRTRLARFKDLRIENLPHTGYRLLVTDR